jgi:hypothetical protein
MARDYIDYLWTGLTTLLSTKKSPPPLSCDVSTINMSGVTISSTLKKSIDISTTEIPTTPLEKQAPAAHEYVDDDIPLPYAQPKSIINFRDVSTIVNSVLNTECVFSLPLSRDQC